MAQKSKSSRKQRRMLRQRSARAEDRGLPGRALEPPTPKPDKSLLVRSRGDRVEAGEAEDEETVGALGTPERARPSFWVRIRDLPTAGKLAILAVLGVIVLAMVAGERDHNRSAAGPVPSGSVQTQPTQVEFKAGPSAAPDLAAPDLAASGDAAASSPAVLSHASARDLPVEQKRVPPNPETSASRPQRASPSRRLALPAIPSRLSGPDVPDGVTAAQPTPTGPSSGPKSPE